MQEDAHPDTNARPDGGPPAERDALPQHHGEIRPRTGDRHEVGERDEQKFRPVIGHRRASPKEKLTVRASSNQGRFSPLGPSRPKTRQAGSRPLNFGHAQNCREQDGRARSPQRARSVLGTSRPTLLPGFGSGTLPVGPNRPATRARPLPAGACGRIRSAWPPNNPLTNPAARWPGLPQRSRCPP